MSDRALTVELEHHAYPIYIGSDLLLDDGLLSRHVMGRQVMLVTNDKIAPLYIGTVQRAFASYQCDVVVVPDGEIHKNQQTVLMIYEALIQHNHHRDTTIIALGGGVVGDVTGFVAATYKRGVRLIHIPTTLLAQVDASIGGKTGINHLGGKNNIGSFYRPHAVIMDLNTLKTLSLRELRSGVAEVIKYGLLVGGDFLALIESFLSHDLIPLNTDALYLLIKQSCQIKAEIVQEDEFETGRRALLNLGHTFAHALESYTNFERWLHGEAVAIGLYCAALLSYQLNLITMVDVDYVDALLKRAQLPRRIPKDIDIDGLYELMFHDKKIKNKSLRFVLMKAFGTCYLDETVTQAQLRSVLLAVIE
jgi:3-dehydroquinate synthase